MDAKFCIIFLCLALSSTSYLVPCDAKRSMRLLNYKRKVLNKNTKKLELSSYLDVMGQKLKSTDVADQSLDSSNTQPYPSSPFSLPPFDSLAPIPLPENAPPFCIYPPNTPQSPSTMIPTPVGVGNTPSAPPPPPPPFYYLPPIFPLQSPPPSPTILTPPATTIPGSPEFVPSPPTVYFPSPPDIIWSPPDYEPSPPSYYPSPPPVFVPNPPSYVVPSPTEFVPSPPLFQPPVVYPPPAVPPPRNAAPSIALWCVAKPSVPDPIIQEAMNYACGSGADCASIQEEGPCFEPNTLFAHASYAFNSYWQRTKVAGGTCSFGGTAMLVTVDPSYDGCRFIYF